MLFQSGSIRIARRLNRHKVARCSRNRTVAQKTGYAFERASRPQPHQSSGMTQTMQGQTTTRIYIGLLANLAKQSIAIMTIERRVVIVLMWVSRLDRYKDGVIRLNGF